jgi:hypothetical protein
VSTIHIDLRLDIVVDSSHRSTAYTAVVMEPSITLLRERIKSVTISPYTYAITNKSTVWCGYDRCSTTRGSPYIILSKYAGRPIRRDVAISLIAMSGVTLTLSPPQAVLIQQPIRPYSGIFSSTGQRLIDLSSRPPLCVGSASSPPF